jgi:hypothetical protein
MGMLAENFAVGLLPALAGPAVLIAVLGLSDKVLPRLLGYVAAFFAVVLTVLGVATPGAAELPALLWLLVSTATLSLYRPHRPSTHAPADRALGYAVGKREPDPI